MFLIKAEKLTETQPQIIKIAVIRNRNAEKKKLRGNIYWWNIRNTEQNKGLALTIIVTSFQFSMGNMMSNAVGLFGIIFFYFHFYNIFPFYCPRCSAVHSLALSIITFSNAFYESHMHCAYCLLLIPAMQWLKNGILYFRNEAYNFDE